MELVREFLKHASECLTMAGKASDPRIRWELEVLAAKWQQLAAEREKYLDSTTRLHKH